MGLSSANKLAQIYGPGGGTVVEIGNRHGSEGFGKLRQMVRSLAFDLQIRNPKVKTQSPSINVDDSEYDRASA